jgi:hypothetical protein
MFAPKGAAVMKTSAGLPTPLKVTLLVGGAHHVGRSHWCRSNKGMLYHNCRHGANMVYFAAKYADADPMAY